MMLFLNALKSNNCMLLDQLYHDTDMRAAFSHERVALIAVISEDIYLEASCKAQNDGDLSESSETLEEGGSRCLRDRLLVPHAHAVRKPYIAQVWRQPC